MNALLLVLPLALHSAPKSDAPVTAYMDTACAEQPGTQLDADAVPTTADMRNAEGARVACAKKAMEKELDAFLVPLKQKDRAAFKTWMSLQADYNKWTLASCDLYERSSGQEGSMAGFAEMACAQRARAHRAWFAKQLASGDLKPFWSVVDAMQSEGEAIALGTAKQLAEAKAPKADADASDNTLLGMEPKDLKAFEAKLKETNAALEKLAAGHCKLLPAAPAGCATKLATYLHAVSGM